VGLDSFDCGEASWVGAAEAGFGSEDEGVDGCCYRLVSGCGGGEGGVLVGGGIARTDGRVSFELRI
jgi:hypothetical protein